MNDEKIKRGFFVRRDVGFDCLKNIKKSRQIAAYIKISCTKSKNNIHIFG